jgi:ATP-dependent DNA helicase Q1
VNRPNLYYEVREKMANAAAVVEDMVQFIKEHYPSQQDSGIVYCFSRKECEQVETRT